MRPCSHCRRQLPRTEFYPARNTRDGLRSWCKDCHRESVARKRWKPTARQQRDKNLRKIGTTLSQFEAVLAAQGGVCAICGGPGPFHADHDHRSKAFRGVLCQLCNQGLGQFRDDPELLTRAIAYLASGGTVHVTSGNRSDDREARVRL